MEKTQFFQCFLRRTVRNKINCFLLRQNFTSEPQPDLGKEEAVECPENVYGDSKIDEVVNNHNALQNHCNWIILLPTQTIRN